MHRENFSKHNSKENLETFKEKVKNTDFVELLYGLHKVCLNFDYRIFVSWKINEQITNDTLGENLSHLLKGINFQPFQLKKLLTDLWEEKKPTFSRKVTKNMNEQFGEKEMQMGQ